MSYLEGCTFPQRDENQLHAAVVELIALDKAEIKYPQFKIGILGMLMAKVVVTILSLKEEFAVIDLKISWTQVETGSAVTWKYLSCILKGDHSIGEFYSVAVTNNFQQVDTGTKMIHIENNKFTIISKGISTSQNSYRGLVKIGKGSKKLKKLFSV